MVKGMRGRIYSSIDTEFKDPRAEVRNLKVPFKGSFRLNAERKFRNLLQGHTPAFYFAYMRTK